MTKKEWRLLENRCVCVERPRRWNQKAAFSRYYFNYVARCRRLSVKFSCLARLVFTLPFYNHVGSSPRGNIFTLHCNKLGRHELGKPDSRFLVPDMDYAKAYLEENSFPKLSSQNHAPLPNCITWCRAQLWPQGLQSAPCQWGDDHALVSIPGSKKREWRSCN